MVYDVLDKAKQMFADSAPEVIIMSALFAFQTVIEIVLSVLLIIGFIYEEKVIAFEKALVKCVKIRLRRYLRRKAAEKANAQSDFTRERKPAPKECRAQRTRSSARSGNTRGLRRFAA